MDEDDSDSDSSADSTLFDNPNEPFSLRPNQTQIIEIKGNFASRKDNLVVFITRDGQPCDPGGRMLKQQGKLPQITSTMLARVRITNFGKFKLIALPIKEEISDTTETKVVTEAIGSLLDACGELGLPTISICAGDIDGMSGQRLRRLLEDTFRGTTTKILICTNQISIPHEKDRRKSWRNSMHLPSEDIKELRRQEVKGKV